MQFTTFSLIKVSQAKNYLLAQIYLNKEGEFCWVHFAKLWDLFKITTWQNIAVLHNIFDIELSDQLN